jgi:hypothetical protein
MESNEQSIISAYNSNVLSGFPTGPGGVEELEAAHGTCYGTLDSTTQKVTACEATPLSALRGVQSKTLSL